MFGFEFSIGRSDLFAQVLRRSLSGYNQPSCVLGRPGESRLRLVSLVVARVSPLSLSTKFWVFLLQPRVS